MTYIDVGDTNALFRNTDAYKRALVKVAPIVDKLWAKGKKLDLWNNFSHTLCTRHPTQFIDLGSEKEHAIDHLCRVVIANTPLHVVRHNWHTYDEVGAVRDMHNPDNLRCISVSHTSSEHLVTSGLTAYLKRNASVLIQEQVIEFEWYGDEEITGKFSRYKEIEQKMRKNRLLQPESDFEREHPFENRMIEFAALMAATKNELSHSI